MRNYPSDHKEIVSQLLDGKFVVYPANIFTTIQENEEDYFTFFKESFGYELIVESDFAYLSSNETTEKKTRDFVLFLAVLSRELDYGGRNFRELIELGTFDMDETEQLLKQSSKWEILEKTSVLNFDTFIETWHKKNVLRKTGGKFKFTKAIKVFFEFAVNVSKSKLSEQAQ